LLLSNVSIIEGIMKKLLTSICSVIIAALMIWLGKAILIAIIPGPGSYLPSSEGWRWFGIGAISYTALVTLPWLACLVVNLYVMNKTRHEKLGAPYRTVTLWASLLASLISVAALIWFWTR
jgi:hypothetical protein